MSRTTDRIQKAARKISKRAETAIKEARARTSKAVSQREKKPVRRQIKEGIVAAGGAVVAGLAVEQVSRALRSRRTVAAITGFEVSLPMGLEAAIERVGSALKAEGFGILTRIDVHTTLRDKLGVSFRPYVILGACNPSLAHRALSARSEAGLLLPCNITVEELPEHTTVVRIADPEGMLRSLEGDSAVREAAVEARERLDRASRSLREHATAVVL